MNPIVLALLVSLTTVGVIIAYAFFAGWRCPGCRSPLVDDLSADGRHILKCRKCGFSRDP